MFVCELGFANFPKIFEKNGEIEKLKSEGTTACIFAILNCIQKDFDLKQVFEASLTFFFILKNCVVSLVSCLLSCDFAK